MGILDFLPVTTRLLLLTTGPLDKLGLTEKDPNAGRIGAALTKLPSLLEGSILGVLPYMTSALGV